MLQAYCPTDVFQAAALSSDGKFALIGSFDKAIGLYSIPNGNRVKKFSRPLSDTAKVWISLAFGPDNASVLAASPSTLYLWENKITLEELLSMLQATPSKPTS